MSIASMCSSMPSSTSRRTGGRPTLLRRSSFSSAKSRFSASSSSTSMSSLRVTRKVVCEITCMPVNSCPRCREMISSSGRKRPSANLTSLDSTGGTLTRANCRPPVCGFFSRTARLIDSPEM